MTTDLELSVVVAALDSDRTLAAALDALDVACVGLRAEILVVAPDSARPVNAGQSSRHIVLTLPGRPGVPDLWAGGIARAAGAVVALTTGQLIVEASWARALVQALVPPAAGAGGPLDLMPGTTPVDWAVFYLRYSAFLRSRWHDGPVSGEIAGDNAAYRLDDLRRHQESRLGGFWEVEFHRCLRAEGSGLRAVSSACARLGPSSGFGAFFRQRLEHGSHFGRLRVREGDRSRLAVVAAAPVVPLVLAWRAGRRVWGDRAHRRRFLIALPAFLAFAAAWAAGEAWGALLK